MFLEAYRIHHMLRSDKKVHNFLTNCCYSAGKMCLQKILNMKYKCEVQHRPVL